MNRPPAEATAGARTRGRSRRRERAASASSRALSSLGAFTPAVAQRMNLLEPVAYVCGHGHTDRPAYAARGMPPTAHFRRSRTPSAVVVMNKVRSRVADQAIPRDGRCRPKSGMSSNNPALLSPWSAAKRPARGTHGSTLLPAHRWLGRCQVRSALKVARTALAGRRCGGHLGVVGEAQHVVGAVAQDFQQQLGPCVRRGGCRQRWCRTARPASRCGTGAAAPVGRGGDLAGRLCSRARLA